MRHFLHQRRYRRLLAMGGVLATAVFAAYAAPALASETHGEKGYYGPVGGHSYWNQNRLYNEGNNGSWGYIEVFTQHGSNVPAGYFGGDARVYKEGGSLCLQGGWEYNSTSAAGESFWSGTGIASKCGGGNYYSSGLSRAWTGYEYKTYSSFSTPFLYI